MLHTVAGRRLRSKSSPHKSETRKTKRSKMEGGNSHLVHTWHVAILTFTLLASVDANHQSQTYIQKMNIISQKLVDVRQCQDSCTFTLTESIPVNLSYSKEKPTFMRTYDAHKRLLSSAKQKIHLSSFYWTLTDSDIPSPDNTSWEGQDIFKSLMSIAKKGQIDVKIAQNNTNNDTDTLEKFGAGVRTLDFQRLLDAGVMHTKMWIVDEAHLYIGSGNFDWRSYTQTREVGVLIENCSCLGRDAEKLFEVYWYLGDPNVTIPHPWPDGYSTDINITSPILVNYNDTKGLVYMSSSPPPFCPAGRTHDLDAILSVIRAAKKFIYISVMDYIPMFIYSKPQKFWSIIDDELRSAAIDRHIKVHLMASHWVHMEPYMKKYLRSLFSLNRMPKLHVHVEVKLFHVPVEPIQRKLIFARVSHSKYMVTDQHAYIGTSNWTGDYFNNTGGVGFILEQPEDGSNGTSLRKQLVQVFKRDWDSKYAKYVDQ